MHLTIFGIRFALELIKISRPFNHQVRSRIFGRDKMSRVYQVQDGDNTVPMKQIHCANEERELQNLLENNFDLLPGDQIDPENPRDWLLIKREMPVPDPNSGADRWSIDFFLVDQTGMPTFVECKRYHDTRSRREVVGQMMEYAANAQYYWDKNILKDLAEKSAIDRDDSLEEVLTSLQQDDYSSVDDFFENVENNLKEGQIRIVFFLEEAPNELRSIVEFLNNQMERAEVLIVEARQYAIDGLKVVVPSLFGYTEQARRIKKAVSLLTPSQGIKWTRDRFIKAVEEAGVPLRSSRVKDLFEMADNNKDIITLAYGRGRISGSLMMKNNTGLTMLVVWDNSSIQLAATGSFRDKFEYLVSLRENYQSWLQWKGRFERGRSPTLVKKLDEMSEEEFEKLKDFTLELAKGVKGG
jgi:hypothetical protein